MRTEIPCEFKKKKKERLILEITEQQYISIWLKDEKEKTRAALYAKYYLRNSIDLECNRSFTVHIETIKVDRKYRRRKIATRMFQTLLNQIIQIEKEENCSFVYLYGEIGKDGGDNPRLSVPFYQSFHNRTFGKERKIVLEIKKNATKEGLDTFCYYIVEETKTS